MDSQATTSTENGQSNGETYGQAAQDFDSSDTLIEDLLQERVDTSLQGLDMGVIKQESFRRTRAAMAAVNPTLANQVLPENKNFTEQEQAAIRIQSQMRGFLARKQYIDLLYEQYEKEEEERIEKARQQVEEGDILVENYKLKTEMNENSCLRRNQRRNLDCSAVTIQRAWRKHKRAEAQVGYDHSKTTPILIDRGDTEFIIRTNPFEKIGHHACYDDDEQDDQSDVFNDSLEHITNEHNVINIEKYSGGRKYCSMGELGDELHEEELNELQSVSSPSDFPSPTTDWESIESCLTSEGETQDMEQNELLDFPNKRLTDFSLKTQDLQICFVDESLLSDDEDEDGCDIKEYVIDKQEISDDEKRDSGCVAGDEEEKETFSIKTLCPDDLISNEVSSDESKHVLLELTKHDVNQEKKQTMQGWTVEKLQGLTLDEVKSLRRNFEQLIQAQNEMLVRELMTRDALHLKQDSMLMEVEDTTKLAQENYQKMHKAVKW